jgi:hypothetical protein
MTRISPHIVHPFPPDLRCRPGSSRLRSGIECDHEIHLRGVRLRHSRRRASDMTEIVLVRQASPHSCRPRRRTQRCRRCHPRCGRWRAAQANSPKNTMPTIPRATPAFARPAPIRAPLLRAMADRLINPKINARMGRTASSMNSSNPTRPHTSEAVAKPCVRGGTLATHGPPGCQRCPGGPVGGTGPPPSEGGLGGGLPNGGMGPMGPDDGGGGSVGSIPALY